MVIRRSTLAEQNGTRRNSILSSPVLYKQSLSLNSQQRKAAPT